MSIAAHIERLPRSLQLALGLGAVALAAFPWLGLENERYYVQMLTQMMILAIFAMSLDLLQGVTGLVSLGHAAFFGLAGYVLAFVTPSSAAPSLWWTLPLAVAASALAALIIGFFVVRTKGIYFIMVTMAFAQMLYYLVAPEIFIFKPPAAAARPGWRRWSRLASAGRATGRSGARPR